MPEFIVLLQKETKDIWLFIQMILLVLFFMGFPIFLILLWLGEWSRKAFVSGKDK